MRYLSEQVENIENLEIELDQQRKQDINAVHKRRQAGAMSDEDIGLLAGYESLLRRKRDVKVAWRQYLETLAK